MKSRGETYKKPFDFVGCYAKLSWHNLNMSGYEI